MNKHPPAKKPQAKIQTVKKQIPVKKIAPDKIEELVKKHLANIAAAENTLKSALALLEKHKNALIRPLVEESDGTVTSRKPRKLGALILRSEVHSWKRHLANKLRLYSVDRRIGLWSRCE